MPQEGENTPQEGQEPTPAPSPSDGQEPKDEPTGESTFDQLPPETQAEIRRLRAEAAKNRKEAQEAAAKVEEYESANQTEVEKLTTKLGKAEERANSAEGRLLRFQVAAAKQLPVDLIDRLQGATQQELEADADKLLELVKPTDAVDFDGGTRTPAPDGQGMNALLRKAAGRT